MSHVLSLLLGPVGLHDRRQYVALLSLQRFWASTGLALLLVDVGLNGQGMGSSGQGAIGALAQVQAGLVAHAPQIVAVTVVLALLVPGVADIVLASIGLGCSILVVYVNGGEAAAATFSFVALTAYMMLWALANVLNVVRGGLALALAAMVLVMAAAQLI